MTPKAPYRVIAQALLLGAAGFLGNWCKLQLFFDVDFLFGSIFVMLAIARLGVAGGVTAGFLAGCCSILFWNHPWAIVIFSCEALFVALANRRWPGNLVMLDTAYWLCLGMPQVWFFYHVVLGTGAQATLLVALKQSVNGIFNALLATIIIYALQLSRPADPERQSLIPFRQLIFIGMVSVCLIPSFVYLVTDIRKTISSEEATARGRIGTIAENAQDLLNVWIKGNHQSIIALSQLVGDPAQTPFPEMQKLVEAIHRANPSLLYLGVLNANCVTVAYSPLVDALGRSTLGIDYSDRPYLAPLKQTLKPMLGDVMMGRIGAPAPRLPLLAPIVVDGSYRGYCAGIINFDWLSYQLQVLVKNRIPEITVLDRQRHVVLSSSGNHQPLQGFDRPGGGETRHLADGIYLWIPRQAKNTSSMQRWSGSFFVKELRLSEEIPWTIVVEESMRPHLDALNRKSIEGFLMLWGLIILTLAASHLLSKRFVVSLRSLAAISTDLPRSIACNTELSWPDTRIDELFSLVGNFRETAAALGENIHSLEELNELLERRVCERTEALRLSEERYSRLVNSANEGVWVIDDQHKTTYVNRRMAQMLGYTEQQMTGRLMEDFVADDKQAQTARLERRRFGVSEQYEARMTKRDGSEIWLTLSAAPLFDSEQRFCGSSAMCTDITERKRVESELSAAHEELERANRSLEILARVDAMTGLANRRHFNETLENEVKRACRSESSLSLIFCDVDFFKCFNDQYGHLAGDSCLASVGEIMRRIFQRTGDLPARYGGEEFAIILPDTTPDEATLMAEQLRQEMIDEALPHAGSDVARCVTISIGVAGGRIDTSRTAQWLTNEADKALYRSKAAGRNRVTTVALQGAEIGMPAT